MSSSAKVKSLRSRQIVADGALLLASLIWGSTFVVTKQAVGGFPVFAFLSMRFALSTIVLYLAFGRRLQWLKRRTVRAGVVIGLFLFSGLALQTMALRYTSAAKVAFIVSMSVAIVPLLSAVVLRDPPSRRATVCVLLATLGLALLTLPPGGGRGPNSRWGVWQAGDLIAFGCAVCFALQIVAVNRLAPRHDTRVLTLLQVAVAAVLSALAALWFEGWPGTIPHAVGVAAAFTGVVAGAVGLTVQSEVQPWTTATRTALILTTEPVFAGIFEYLVGGERLAPTALAGCGLIVLGTVLAVVRPAAPAKEALRSGLERKSQHD
jgi:drug/metabolite transporter (DMT)-like permease